MTQGAGLWQGHILRVALGATKKLQCQSSEPDLIKQPSDLSPRTAGNSTWPSNTSHRSRRCKHRYSTGGEGALRLVLHRTVSIASANSEVLLIQPSCSGMVPQASGCSHCQLTQHATGSPCKSANSQQQIWHSVAGLLILGPALAVMIKLMMSAWSCVLHNCMPVPIAISLCFKPASSHAFSLSHGLVLSVLPCRMSGAKCDVHARRIHK